MTIDERHQRIARVLNQRLDRVHCAIEALYHRHNVSAVLRTCDAMGLHHVHLVEGHFKPGSGAARGAGRWLNLNYHSNATQAIADLRAQGVAIWVADFDENAVPPEEVPIDRPVCLWFGSELSGVSAEARAAADGVVCIPMRGFAQSLNVSVAAAVALRPVAERARALGPEALLPESVREATWTRWMSRERHARRAMQARVEWTPPAMPTPQE